MHGPVCQHSDLAIAFMNDVELYFNSFKLRFYHEELGVIAFWKRWNQLGFTEGLPPRTGFYDLSSWLEELSI